MLCKCKAHGKRICSTCFWTMVFWPVEHFLWEKAPVLRSISHLMGI